MGIVVGTRWLDPTPPKYHFFTLGVLARRDGVSSKSQIEWHAAGKRRFLFDARVVLTSNRTRGTFSGKLEDGSIATGSFRC